MYSVRSFFVLWSCFTLAILGYAGLDLALHPQLRRETHFSMQPDIYRVGELVHWGGRLMKEGHVGLLVANGILLGGLAALSLAAMGRVVRPREGEEQEAVARMSLP